MNHRISSSKNEFSAELRIKVAPWIEIANGITADEIIVAHSSELPVDDKIINK